MSIFIKNSRKKIRRIKNQPLEIDVETIKSNKDSRFLFEGKLVTISNPFNVKLVSHQGTQGANREKN